MPPLPPLPSPPPLMPDRYCYEIYGAGDCSEFGNGGCSGHGNCTHGRCVCETGHSGLDCSVETSCRYFDKAKRAWSSEGCTTVAPCKS